MLYVGLDMHSKRISLCVLSETRQVVRRTQVRTIEEMMRILYDMAFSRLPASRGFSRMIRGVPSDQSDSLCSMRRSRVTIRPVSILVLIGQGSRRQAD